MVQLAYLAIVNAMLAALLGLLVWWISRWIRRPALVHVLWILVLVRLVTPPLLVFHVTGLGAWLSATIPSQAAEMALTVVRDVTSQQTRMLAMMRSVLDHEDLIPRMDLAPRGLSEPLEARLTTYVPVTHAVDFSVAALQWIQGSCVYATQHAGKFLDYWVPIWLAGTAACCLIQLYLGLRFRARLRRESYTSRIWQARTERIARRMGLRSCPAVLLVRATISPMLWGFGSRTRLLFPERLLETLNASSQNTLLAHELAHYRRGDQWVRLLELFVTSLFWWHPVVWWARYHIEAAEEECCDACAVTQANGCSRTYAEALLTTVDFMSLGLPIMPPAASGVGSRLLRKRLTTIMRGASQPPWLTPEACAGVWILAVFVLVPCPAIWQAFGGTTAVLSDNVVALALPGPQRFVEPTKTMAAVRRTTSDVVSRRLADHSSLFAESANGQFLLTLGSDQRACLREFSIPGGRIPGVAPSHALDLGVGRVASADFSPSDPLLAIGGLDGTVELIDCQSGNTLRRWSTGGTAVLSVAFSPDGQHLAIGNRAGECKVFQISPFGLETIQRERGKRVSCVRYSVDGSCLAVVVHGNSRDTQIDVWDLVSGRSCGSFRPERTVAAVLATKTANEWLIVEHDGTARVWSTDGHLTSAQLIVPEALIRQLGFAPTRAETLQSWLAADQPVSVP